MYKYMGDCVCIQGMHLYVQRHLCGNRHSSGCLGGMRMHGSRYLCVEWVGMSVCDEELEVVTSTVVLARIC